MSKCKYMRSKHNYTPNDYDLTFNYNEVPSNIQMNDATSINRKIAAVTPLSKKIHIQLNTTQKEFTQQINTYTTMKINGKEVKII